MDIQTPRGTRDLPPEEMEKRNWIVQTIRCAYESFGFRPLETPAFESWELLSKKGGGGDAIKDEIYYFKDKSGRELGLRFDLTMPLARFIATNPQLPKPFKRYQIGRVWRYDRPQAGRFREFWQADIDIIGSSSMDADAECIAAVSRALSNLGLKKFNIRVNNRKILNGLAKSLGLEKKSSEIFRVLDKLEKIGEIETAKELRKIDVKAEKILKTINVGFQSLDPSTEGMDELQSLVSGCKRFGVKVTPDLSLVRGLDYYTGSIFEIEAGEGIGSIAGGGRYDNLICLLGGQETPAVGISIGVDRLSEVLKASFKKPSQVLVASVKPELLDESIKLATQLRQAGISCLTDVSGKGLRKQLDYVNSAGLQWVIFVGPDEVKAKSFTLRDMRTGKESKLGTKALIEALQKA